MAAALGSLARERGHVARWESDAPPNRRTARAFRRRVDRFTSARWSGRRPDPRLTLGRRRAGRPCGGDPASRPGIGQRWHASTHDADPRYGRVRGALGRAVLRGDAHNLKPRDPHRYRADERAHR